MAKNKYYLLSSLGILLISASLFGFNVMASSNNGVQREGFSSGPKHQEMRQGLKELSGSEDYQSWSESMDQKADALEERARQIRENITQERFGDFLEIHELMEDGEYEKARELKEELGIGRHGFGKCWQK